MRNKDFSNEPVECEKWDDGDYKYDRRFAPELFLGTRGGNGVESVREAWNDYIGNVLMMDPDWPPDVNVFAWQNWKMGVFASPHGEELPREIKEILVDCMERHGFNAQMSRYGGWIMTMNRGRWITSNGNRDGFKDRSNLGIIDGLFDLITDEACQPFWD
jgi:hypothetical protein